MSIRKPLVAGQFYPASADELETDIKRSFTGKFGPGKVAGKRGEKKIEGVVSPHAGYFFSGAGAAWVFKEIGEAMFADTYVILGVNHAGAKTCSSNEDWETPLGTISCDEHFVKVLEEKGLPVNNSAHHREHSIEVQLPLLQFVSKDKIKDLRIVPIMIADEQFEKWGKIILSAIKETKRNVVIICSSDFTHYGHNYGYIPFEKDVPGNMKKLDTGAIEFIEKLDAQGFLDYVQRTGATICGRCGIAVLLWLMKNKDDKIKGELLKYYTSGDVVGDYSNAVGYASILFN